MSSKTLHEIEASIDQLDWPDQVRLLEYLAPRIGRGVRGDDANVSGPDQTLSATPHGNADEAVRRYREVAAQIAAASAPGAPSMLEELTRSRR